MALFIAPGPESSPAERIVRSPTAYIGFSGDVP